jgi:hypothetical protein
MVRRANAWRYILTAAHFRKRCSQLPPEQRAELQPVLSAFDEQDPGCDFMARNNVSIASPASSAAIPNSLVLLYSLPFANA